jgi:hypothetical protein
VAPGFANQPEVSFKRDLMSFRVCTNLYDLVSFFVLMQFWLSWNARFDCGEAKRLNRESCVKALGERLPSLRRSTAAGDHRAARPANGDSVAM